MKIITIIPAGGRGLRSGFNTPKQYLKINGKEIIAYCLETFQKNKLINEIVIAAEPNYFNLIIRLVNKYNLKKVKKIVEGGLTRQKSVFNALLSVNADKNDLIVVHDAARALLPDNILNKALNLAIKEGNAVVCLNAKDTLIKGKNTINEYLNREEVFYVQTPQIFRYNVLLRAFENANDKNIEATDESYLVKLLGKKVFISEGSIFNFKVTTKDDVVLFKKIVTNYSSKLKIKS